MTGHSDPIHPPDELYARLAACLMDRLASSSGRSSSKSCAEPFPKRNKLVSAGSTSSGNRGRGWQANRGEEAAAGALTGAAGAAVAG